MITDIDHLERPETSPGEPENSKTKTFPADALEAEQGESGDSKTAAQETGQPPESRTAEPAVWEVIRSSQDECDPRPRADEADEITNTDQPSLETAAARSAVPRIEAGPSNNPGIPHDKRTTFSSEWPQLGSIEVKESTDPNILMFDGLLHPCTDDTMLKAKGIVRLLGLFPPQGYFRRGAFVVVIDWGLIARARQLLDPTTPIPVMAYRSAVAAKPLALRQLGLYYHLCHTPTREILRARIGALHASLLPEGSEEMFAANKRYLARLSGRSESTLRPSERGKRRKLSPLHNQPITNEENGSNPLDHAGPASAEDPNKSSD